MDGIWNHNRRVKWRNGEMVNLDAIPTERDTISRNNSCDRIIARFDDRFGIREDPIGDCVEREFAHAKGHFPRIGEPFQCPL
jgi:hypothetical protein